MQIKKEFYNVVSPNTNDMKNLTINNKEFSPVIEENDIVLYGLTEEITLIGAGDEFNHDAEEAATFYVPDYNDDGFMETSKEIDKDVYNSYVVDRLPDFCSDWLAKGKPSKTETLNLN